MSGGKAGKWNYFTEAKSVLVKSVQDVTLPESLEEKDLVSALKAVTDSIDAIEIQYLPNVITIDKSLPNDGSEDIPGKSYHSFATAYVYTHAHQGTYYKILLPSGELQEDIIVENNLIIEGNNTQVDHVMSYCWSAGSYYAKVSNITLLSGDGSSLPGTANTIYDAGSGRTGYLWLENCVINEENFVTDSDDRRVCMVAQNCTFIWADNQWGIRGPIDAFWNNCTFVSDEFLHPCVFTAFLEGSLKINNSTFTHSSCLRSVSDSIIEVNNCTFDKTLSVTNETDNPVEINSCTVAGGTTIEDGTANFRNCNFSDTVNFWLSSDTTTFTDCTGSQLTGTCGGDIELINSNFSFQNLSAGKQLRITGSNITSVSDDTLTCGSLVAENSILDLYTVRIASEITGVTTGRVWLTNSLIRHGWAIESESLLLSFISENSSSGVLYLGTEDTPVRLNELKFYSCSPDYVINCFVPQNSTDRPRITAYDTNVSLAFSISPYDDTHVTYELGLVVLDRSALYIGSDNTIGTTNYASLILCDSIDLRLNSLLKFDHLEAISWGVAGKYWRCDTTSYADEALLTLARLELPDQRDRLTVRYSSDGGAHISGDTPAGATHVGLMSILGGDPANPDNFTWIPLNSTLVDNDTSSTSAAITLADNTIFNRDILASLTVTMPSGITPAFTSQINFTSGATPTTFSALGIDFTGDDTSGSIFTPTARKRYMVMFTHDGLGARGLVSATDVIIEDIPDSEDPAEPAEPVGE